MKCMHCERWRNESPGIPDEDAYGWCEICEWGCYGSDLSCNDFEMKW